MTASNASFRSHAAQAVCGAGDAPIAGPASAAINPPTEAAARSSRLDMFAEPDRGLLPDGGGLISSFGNSHDQLSELTALP